MRTTTRFGRRDIHSARIKVASTLVVALLFSLDVASLSLIPTQMLLVVIHPQLVDAGTSKMNLDAILRDSVH